MHTYLRELLFCPNCKNELTWDISDEDDAHIIDAGISCASCGKEYFIKDGIACFLVDFKDVKDDWEEGSKFLDSYFEEFPHLKEKLMSAPIESLNGADLYARAEVLKTLDSFGEAEEVRSFAEKKIWSHDYLKAEEMQLSYLINRLAGEKGFTVDIASGMGRLIDGFLEHTAMDIVSTDISYSVLLKSRQKRKDSKNQKRISYMVFDIKAIPFRDKSIQNMTTVVGLQNVGSDYEQIIKELYRVCEGTFYADCQFFQDDDTVHKTALIDMGMEKFFFRDTMVSEFEKYGWKAEVKNSVVFPMVPTPVGKIVKDYGIDALPIIETNCESCVVVMTN